VLFSASNRWALKVVDFAFNSIFFYQRQTAQLYIESLNRMSYIWPDQPGAAFSSIDIPSMPLVSFFFLSMLKVNSQLTEDESGAD